MANIALYHTNVLNTDATVTTTGLTSNSEVAYVYDDRLSFKFVNAGSAIRIQIDQPSGSILPWEYVAICNHTSLAGGEVTVFKYDTSLRNTAPTNTASGVISSDNPFVLQNLSGAVRSADQFIDIEITGPVFGQTWNIGELMLVPKFTSPQRPGVGIATDYLPRITFIPMPNGERQTIKHAETSRKKTYTIPGLSIAEAQEWVEVFLANEGAHLVILEDDRGDKYPCFMATSLTVDDVALTASIELVFEEVKL